MQSIANNGFVKPLSSMSLYEIAIFFVFLDVGLQGLYIVSSNSTIGSIVGWLGPILDLLLVIITLTKLGDIRHSPLIVILIVLGAAIAYESGSIIVIKSVLLIVCAKGESYLKIVKLAKFALLAVLIIGLCSDVTGFASTEAFRRNGLALGFIHPNQAALTACVILLLDYVEQSMSKNRFSPFPVSLIMLVCIILTGSKTGFVLAAIPLLLYFVFRGFYNGSNKVFNRILLFAMFGMLLFSIVSAVFLFEVPMFQSLNSFFTGRLWLNWFALSNFDFTLFGQTSNLSIEGVYNPTTGNWNTTTTIDCSYIVALIRYGAIGLFLWAFAYVVAVKRALDSASPAIAVAAAILALYAFTESQLFTAIQFFPLLCIFSDLECANEGSGSDGKIGGDVEYG